MASGNEIRAGVDGLERLMKLAENASNIGPRELRQAVQVGVPEAERMARKYLASRLQRSGVGRKTGQLMNMIKRSTLSIIDPASSRVSLTISMPGGMDKKDYIKANSLNYGAVRGGKGSLLSQKGATGRHLIGETQRRKLKAAAGTTKSGDFYRSVSRDISARSVQKTDNGSTVLDTTVGKATVTKAFKFFWLSDKQIDTIKNVVFGSAMEYLQAKITGRRVRRKAA